MCEDVELPVSSDKFVNYVHMVFHFFTLVLENNIIAPGFCYVQCPLGPNLHSHMTTILSAAPCNSKYMV